MPIIVDKDRKRRDILQAAMRVFARDGYHRAKMEAVAEEAGIGKGTVYEYFKSKTDLFLVLYDHMLAELKDFYMKELAGIQQPAAILERFIAVAFQTFRVWEPFFLVFFDFWAEGGRGEQQALLQTRLREAYAVARADVAAIIAAGVKDGSFRCDNPSLAAASILATLDGLVLQWLCDRDAFDLDAMRETLTQGILRGLQP
ncbi:MAG: TetR/AcrR family transcriptional regulator [Candidatus Methylomirabilales bacterium]|nr:TetR/AcrR family transcriptional regulator [candidate division NC10 bacterium]